MTRVLALAATATVAAACARVAVPETPASGTHGLMVQTDATAAVVAAAVTVPGPGREPSGREGLALLTAATLMEQARPALDGLGARAYVRCGAFDFTFRLVAPEDEWRTALGLFLDALFRPDPGAAALERARDRLARSLALVHGSPAREARVAARQALYGVARDGEAWTDDPCGGRALAGLTIDQVRAEARRFDERGAAVVVLGAVAPDEVGPLLAGRSSATAPGLASPDDPRPGRRVLERNVTTTWVAVAFPFRPDADIDAIHMIGALLVDAIGPGPDQPDLLAAGWAVERHGGGGALVVHAVARPGSALDFADRLESRVEEWRRAPPDGSWYRQVARRHHGARLLERDAPEDRAAAMALELATGRPAGTGWPTPVGSDRIGPAARGLGPAARALVGPAAGRGGDTP